MRLLVLCDHDLPRIRNLPAERVDVVVGCGDLHDTALLQAVDSFRAPAIAVKGNHDPDSTFPKPVVDLHLAVQTVGGVTFGGHQGAWRYKPRGHFLYEDEEVAETLRFFPRVDVFIAHNPPAGVHDRDDGVHNGFRAFRDYIERHRPRAFIHGHVDLDQETLLGGTRVIAACGWKVVEL